MVELAGTVRLPEKGVTDTSEPGHVPEERFVVVPADALNVLTVIEKGFGFVMVTVVARAVAPGNKPATASPPMQKVPGEQGIGTTADEPAAERTGVGAVGVGADPVATSAVTAAAAHRKKSPTRWAPFLITLTPIV